MFIWQMRVCAEREQHDLGPGDYAFDEWVSEFERSAAYRSGDELVGLDAVLGSLGSSAIVATVKRGDEKIPYSFYFNQMADEPDGDPQDPERTEYGDIENDAREWLVTMAGATEWRDWDWKVVE